MTIRFDLILDWLKDSSVSRIPADLSGSFCHSSLLPDDPSCLNPEYLYICTPAEALSLSSAHPEIFFLCPSEPGDACQKILQAHSRPAPDFSCGNILTTDFPGGIKALFLFIEEKFFFVSDWYTRMQELILQNASVQELITLSEPVIGNTINISDSAFTLLATTYGIPTDDEISLQLRKHGYHPESTLNLMRLHDRFAVYEAAGTEPIVFRGADDFGPYDQVNRIFRFQNIYFTHAVMVCDHKPLTPGLLELFEILSKMLAILMKQEWDKRSHEDNNFELFLKNIIEENLTDLNEIERRSTYFGFPANEWYELTAVSTENDIGIYKTRFIRELSELLPSSKVMLLYDLFLILSPASKNHEKASGMSSYHLERFLKRNMASGGSSGVFFGLKSLPIAYRRAALALKYSPANCRGRAYIEQPDESEDPVICTFSDCFSRCIAGESQQGELLWRNSSIGKALITLCRHDIEHNNNNLPLLYAYLLSGMSASQTAALFHMHRNNVPYRINRISSIVGMDVTDEKLRTDLLFSFIMFDIYGP